MRSFVNFLPQTWLLVTLLMILQWVIHKRSQSGGPQVDSNLQTYFACSAKTSWCCWFQHFLTYLSDIACVIPSAGTLPSCCIHPENSLLIFQDLVKMSSIPLQCYSWTLSSLKGTFLLGSHNTLWLPSCLPNFIIHTRHSIFNCDSIQTKFNKLFCVSCFLFIQGRSTWRNPQQEHFPSPYTQSSHRLLSLRSCSYPPTTTAYI